VTLDSGCGWDSFLPKEGLPLPSLVLAGCYFLAFIFVFHVVVSAINFYWISTLFLYEDFSKMIFWLGLKLEIS